MMTIPTIPISISAPMASTAKAHRDAERLMNSDDPNKQAQGAALMSMLNSEFREEYTKTLDENKKNTQQRKAALLGARKASKSVGYNSSTVFGGGQTDETGITLG